ncbi:hypothetical protein PtA15_5A436 [Puccinia triticina]|uniref:Uncharacterized protein n=1 Tax=Puccinia triticina TaxID=208348 RepID=A0ABY7CI24_9BASI|nr:uncharacterized protein PtA15_5A436 [Puccinia triticina]WAQ84863.1 hypothetical protein PtA15_5A436 [Puccinia triticina]WAR58211.1 hypothetical protein PtB15_5B443 [Puccinia triticina]
MSDKGEQVTADEDAKSLNKREPSTTDNGMALEEMMGAILTLQKTTQRQFLAVQEQNSA